MSKSKIMSEFKNIAILAHQAVSGAAQEAELISGFFAEHGIKAQHGDFADESIQAGLQQGDFDLAITIGGDGTVLRAGHLCAPKDIPLLAIDMGRFGFLIELEPQEWPEMLPRLLNNDYWFERRMMLSVDLYRDGEIVHQSDALNEAMIGRGRIVRPVHLRVSLDGLPLSTYVADGLIVSTATGSTAYALASGGPILPPELRNILLLPVAPHLSVDRAIVLAEGATIRVEVIKGEQAVLSIDGQLPVDLQLGDMIELRASKHSLRFLRFQEAGYFYQRLLAIMDNNPATNEKNHD